MVKRGEMKTWKGCVFYSGLCLKETGGEKIKIKNNLKELKKDFHRVVCTGTNLFVLTCLPLGGLAAVIYTDTLQTFIMVVGSFILMGFGK